MSCQIMLTLKRQFLWTREIKPNPPTVEYADVMRNDQGVGEWLEKLVSSLSLGSKHKVNLVENIWILLRRWMPSLARGN